MMSKLILFILLVTPFPAWTQMSLNDLQIHRVPQKKVVEFVQHQMLTHNFTAFQEIQPTLIDANQTSGFRTHRATYKVKSDLPDVWQGYQNANPSESWEGKRFSFGFAFNRNKEELVYRENKNTNGVEEGQMFYVNLKLMAGVYNLAVAFEIITVDPEQKVMEFSYLEGGQSKGMQRIELVENSKGETDIIHTSFFKSDSKFRDAVLYPFFHKRIINEFHRRMRKRFK